MMEIGRIAHAGLHVSAAGVRCLMGPVLIQPFESGANCFEPPVRIDVAQAADCDVVIFSHEHGDHFSIPSLHLIPRERPILYPKGADLIEHALAALGFHNRHAVSVGSTMMFGPLHLTFTPSEVPFAEMGVLFAHDGAYAWNCVDCQLGERAFKLVASRTSRLDIMLAAYQPLVEEPLGHDALGSTFPFAHHRRNLAAVMEANPRCVIPSSCGYRYTTAAWQNARGFPVSEEEFIADLSQLAPAIKGVSLAPGASIDSATLEVRPAALSFVSPLPRAAEPDPRAWRPDEGVERLRDDDPYGRGSAALRCALEDYLDTRFFTDIASVAQREWRSRLARAQALWRLEVVYPDGYAEVRWLDFANAERGWERRPARVPKIRTTICASTLAGLLTGEVTPYRALFTRRVALKLYGVEHGRIALLGTLADEPIGRLLFEPAAWLNVEFELQRLGCALAGRGRRRVGFLPRRP